MAKQRRLLDKRTAGLMRVFRTYALLFSLLLCSCIKETEMDITDSTLPQSAWMTVGINNETSLSSDYREEIKTVRIIVFNNASTNPVLDVNTLNVINTPAVGTGIDIDMAVTVNSDKMIIAIINEPSQLSNQLSVLNHPSSFEDIDYNFAHILNSNHTTILSNVYMPMTGVKRGFAVNKTHTAGSPLNINMTVERILARIDIYLKKNMTETTQLTTSTTIKLKNTFNKGYFAAGTMADGTRYQTGGLISQNFGHMMTIAPHNLTYVSWSPLSTVNVGTTLPGSPTCSFYTPERTCQATGNADKLILEFTDINLVGIGPRHGEVVLSHMTDLPGGVTNNSLTEIRRNNVYTVTGTVNSHEMLFEAQVIDWNDADLSSGFNESRYLNVSKYECFVNSAFKKDKIVIKTDYPGGWSAALYNDPACTVNISPAGWMTLAPMNGPATTTNGTEIIITLDNSVSAGQTRYIKFTAGRRQLVVKVTMQ